MLENLRDLLDVIARWIHLIAGIMWVGNSMLFNWLDRNLIKPDPNDPTKKLEHGRIWLLHSGAFYDVTKKLLAPGEMPSVLHWFKWQAYTTWITGFSLLFIVYYWSAESMMVDPEVMMLTKGQAIGVGLGTVVGGFLVYDLLWRSPIGKKVEELAIAISLALLAGAVWGLTHVLSGRAAYLHTGAMLGTCMAGNVFFHIIPSQRALVKETESGQPQDARLSLHAKQRSIHNNYITFPVLFLMISNHFAGVTGNSLNWLILAVLIVSGAGVRHILNVRFGWKQWIPALAGTIVASVAVLFFLIARPQGETSTATVAVPAGAHVSFTTVQLIVDERCKPCHSRNPSDKTAPRPPINFDTPDEIKAASERIKVRAVITKTMPLGNKTAMTQDERDLLARWILQGASVAD